jgi:hypothetical protein
MKPKIKQLLTDYNTALKRENHLLELSFTYKGSRQLQIENLILYLNKSKQFYTAPASGKYHLNVEGGLFIHSLSVFENMMKLSAAIAPDLSSESIFIMAMFHDLHKADDGYGVCQYKEQTNQWRVNNLGENYVFNKEVFSLNKEFKSVLLLLKYIELSPAEIQAICYHHAGYEKNFDDVKNNLFVETVLLNTADLISAQFEE